MKRFVIACLLLGSGCFWASKQSEEVFGYDARTILRDDGHVHGGAVQVGGGYAGLTVNVEADLRDTVRPGDPKSYTALGLGLSARASVLGIIANDHSVERYFDIGGEGGGSGNLVPGAPSPNLIGTGSAWYGA